MPEVGKMAQLKRKQQTSISLTPEDFELPGKTALT